MKRLMMAAILAGAALFSGVAFAADAGQFTEIQGSVLVERGGRSMSAVLGTVVQEGDQVKTEKNGKATLLFKDGSVLRLGPSTSIRVKKLSYDQDKGVAKSAYDLAHGTMMFVVGSVFGNDDSEFEVKTPTAVSGVRGTMGIIQVTVDSSGKATTAGVSLENTVFFQGANGGSWSLEPNQYSVAGPDGIALDPSTMDPAILEQLLETTRAQSSLNQRAGGMRDQGGQGPPGVPPDDLVPPDYIPGSGGSGDYDPNDPGGDSPGDLIYQEPPQATELQVIIKLGSLP